MEAKIIYIEYRVLGNPISIRESVCGNPISMRESVKTYTNENGVTKREKILKNLVILWSLWDLIAIANSSLHLKMYVSQKISLQNQVLDVECCLEATPSREQDLVKKLNIKSANLEAKHNSLK